MSVSTSSHHHHAFGFISVVRGAWKKDDESEIKSGKRRKRKENRE